MPNNLGSSRCHLHGAQQLEPRVAYRKPLNPSEVESGLDRALRDHLQFNHYPPLPTSLVVVAATAIQIALDGNRDGLLSTLQLPPPCRFRGRDWLTVAEALDAMHLEEFLRESPMEDCP